MESGGRQKMLAGGKGLKVSETIVRGRSVLEPFNSTVTASPNETTVTDATTTGSRTGLCHTGPTAANLSRLNSAAAHVLVSISGVAKIARDDTVRTWAGADRDAEWFANEEQVR